MSRAFVHDIQDAICLFSVQTLAAINLCGVFVWDSWAFAGSFCSVPDSGFTLYLYFLGEEVGLLRLSLAHRFCFHSLDGQLWYSKSDIFGLYEVEARSFESLSFLV